MKSFRKAPTQSGVAISRKCCFPHGVGDAYPTNRSSMCERVGVRWSIPSGWQIGARTRPSGNAHCIEECRYSFECMRMECLRETRRAHLHKNVLWRGSTVAGRRNDDNAPEKAYRRKWMRTAHYHPTTWLVRRWWSPSGRTRASMVRAYPAIIGRTGSNGRQSDAI